MTDKPDIKGGINSASVAAEQLRTFIERIERLNEEKAGIAGDIKELYLELRGNGFDVKTVRDIIRMRAKDPDKLAEEMALLELYGTALGMGVFG